MAVKPVKIYSSPTCPYCAMAKQLMSGMKIPFKEFDVSTDEQAAHEMIHKSGQIGVPVIEIGNTILLGFDKGALLKILEEEGVIRKKAEKTGAAEKPAAKTAHPKRQAARKPVSQKQAAGKSAST